MGKINLESTESQKRTIQFLSATYNSLSLLDYSWKYPDENIQNLLHIIPGTRASSKGSSIPFPKAQGQPGESKPRTGHSYTAARGYPKNLNTVRSVSQNEGSPPNLSRARARARSISLVGERGDPPLTEPVRGSAKRNHFVVKTEKHVWRWKWRARGEGKAREGLGYGRVPHFP